MAEASKEELAAYSKNRVLVDPYLDWSVGEGVPIYEDFGAVIAQPFCSK
jgi:hypothetical protein